MTPTLVTCTYGRSAAHALAGAVGAAKDGDPLAPVSVVVPSNYVGVATRRLMASGQLGPVVGSQAGVAAVQFLTIYRVAELLGAAHLAAQGRRPVSTPVVATAIRQVLQADPGIFAPVAAHAATELALVRTHRELSELPDEMIDRLAVGDRGRDVVRIHRETRRILSAQWYDEADLTRAAAAALSDGSPYAGDLGHVVLYLPQRLTPNQVRMLTAVAHDLPLTVVAGFTGHDHADAPVVDSLRRLGLDPPGAPNPEPSAATASEIRVVTASDPDEEVRAAVREVVAAAAAGTPLDRIAVVYAADSPYARLTHEHLAQADVAHNGAAVRPVADRLLARGIRALLALPDNDFARHEVMGLVTSGAARWGGQFLPTSAWERISRNAGVVRGLGGWETGLNRFIDDHRNRSATLAQRDDISEGRLAFIDREIERAQKLHDYVAELGAELTAGPSTGLRSWGDTAEWVRQLVRRFLTPEHRRIGWPEVEINAAERVEAAIDRLAGLDAMVPQTDLDGFRRTLDLVLDADLGRVGRLGEGVLIGRIDSALGLDLDLVIVLGLAEGLFPSRHREDSLLPDRDRARVEGLLPGRMDRIADEHRYLLAALAAAGGEVVVSMPRGDLRQSNERVASRWLLDIIEAQRSHDGEPGFLRDLPAAAPWYRPIPSFAAGLADEPATPGQYRLRTLAHHHGQGKPLVDTPLAATDPVLGLAAQLVEGRESDQFTRFDGNLTTSADRPDMAQPTSATALQQWVKCPHAYFMEKVLGLSISESPEEILEISPLDKGSLIHEVLEQFLREQLDDQTVPAPGDPWPDRARERLMEISDQVATRYQAMGLTGTPLYWRQDWRNIRRVLQRFLIHDHRYRDREGATPTAVEAGFGTGGAATGPVEIDLLDGRTLTIRGAADRIDQLADGTIHVIDYKSGKVDRYKDLSPENPDANGTMLQLPVYALAGRAILNQPDAPARGSYWFVEHDKDEPNLIGYDITPPILDRYRHVLSTIANGVQAGLFPARPAAPKSYQLRVECHWCDPDGLGTTARFRHWERKATDPALAPYLALVEPDQDGNGV